MIEREELQTVVGPALPRLQLVRRVHLQAGWSLASLAAPFWRLYLPLQDGGQLVWRGRKLPLRPGSGYLLAPDTAARALQTAPFGKAFAHFVWTPQARQVRPGIHTFSLDDRQRRGLTALPVGGTDALLGLVCELLGLGLASLPEEAFVPRPQLEPRVARTMALLSADPSLTPDNAALGRAVGLHPNSLVRLFSQAVGSSPQRWALDWRLGRAAEMLVASAASIEQIAEACGFVDRHHFGRAFRRRWDCPPAEFRHRNRA